MPFVVVVDQVGENLVEDVGVEFGDGLQSGRQVEGAEGDAERVDASLSDATGGVERAEGFGRVVGALAVTGGPGTAAGAS